MGIVMCRLEHKDSRVDRLIVLVSELLFWYWGLLSAHHFAIHLFCRVKLSCLSALRMYLSFRHITLDKPHFHLKSRSESHLNKSGGNRVALLDH